MLLGRYFMALRLLARLERAKRDLMMATTDEELLAVADELGAVTAMAEEHGIALPTDTQEG